MTPLEIILSYLNIFFALIVFNFVFLRPETRRIIKVVKHEFPVLGKAGELLKDREFINFVAETAETIEMLNKTVRQVRELVRGIAPAFCAPEIYESFFKEEKPKGVEKNE